MGWMKSERDDPQASDEPEPAGDLWYFYSSTFMLPAVAGVMSLYRSNRLQD